MDHVLLEELQSKLGFSRQGKGLVGGLVVLLIMVAVLAGPKLLSSATASESDLQVVQASENRDNDSSDGKPDEAATIFVHVMGAVSNSGLVELPEGSRIADAIAGAGGLTPDADASSVNLARVVSDGEQVFVAELNSEDGSPIRQSADEAQAVTAQSSTGTAQNGKVNINTAAKEELITLPGIGEATAQKIISDRKANGPFNTIDDLTRVSGIGQKKLESLEGLICI